MRKEKKNYLVVFVVRSKNIQQQIIFILFRITFFAVNNSKYGMDYMLFVRFAHKQHNNRFSPFS